jgi:hypothetical protein
MVIEAGLFAPEYEPVPLPVQVVKLLPSDGVALIETLVPAVLQLLVGLTVPPVPAFIVR